jgi:hypothetical protein
VATGNVGFAPPPIRRELRRVEVEVFHAGERAADGVVPTNSATVQFSDDLSVFTYTASVGTVRRMLEYALRELDR